MSCDASASPNFCIGEDSHKEVKSFFYSCSNIKRKPFLNNKLNSGKVDENRERVLVTQ